MLRRLWHSLNWEPCRRCGKDKVRDGFTPNCDECITQMWSEWEANKEYAEAARQVRIERLKEEIRRKQ